MKKPFKAQGLIGLNKRLFIMGPRSIAETQQERNGPVHCQSLVYYLPVEYSFVKHIKLHWLSAELRQRDKSCLERPRRVKRRQMPHLRLSSFQGNCGRTMFLKTLSRVARSDVRLNRRNLEDEAESASFSFMYIAFKR